MTDETPDPMSSAERRERAELERRALRDWLREAKFDGPFPLGPPSGFGLFGVSYEGAVCLQCGSLVMLGDGMDNPERAGERIERGVYLHVKWHERA